MKVGSMLSECWPADAPGMQEFCDRVWEEGRAHGRDLPWRHIADPYGVLVSEIMLQQTQVTRVLRYWQRFMSLFPTIDALAAADASDVLAAWQGLGYNRRALALKRAADECSAQLAGRLPETVEDLQKLPGIGLATAAGVMSFAHNKPSVYLETNVRAVFLHELFPDREKVSDKELVPLVAASCPQDNPRDWYYALLDYGAYLKQTQVNPSRRSAHHVRQSTFEGSRRQKRAELLRCVLAAESDGISEAALRKALDKFEREHGRDAVDAELFEGIVSDMVAEGFFRRENGLYRA